MRTFRGSKIALEGPINGCSDVECIDWRQLAISHLGHLYEFHNPMDFDCRGKEAELEGELIAFDEKGIKESQIVLVNAERPGWGTAMAVQMAWDQGKFILTVFPGEKISPWLKNRSSEVQASMNDAILRLKELAGERIHWGGR